MRLLKIKMMQPKSRNRYYSQNQKGFNVQNTQIENEKNREKHTSLQSAGNRAKMMSSYVQEGGL